jgi:uncharacterized membrane protein YeaQ/YmgE (transglycosylase-associated protein family)
MGSVMNLVYFLSIGLAAGWLASRITGRHLSNPLDFQPGRLRADRTVSTDDIATDSCAEPGNGLTRVFISYSSLDKQWADAACSAMEQHRIRCWIAPRDITPGAEWGAAIISGIDESRIMVVILSANANESPQVRREVERAISKGLILVPFRIENIKPTGALEFALSSAHWLDGFTPPVERQLERLATSVQSLPGKNARRAAGLTSESVDARRNPAGAGVGFASNLIIGVIGALLGGYLSGLLGITASGIVGNLIMATVGAIGVLLLVGMIRRLT